MMDPLCLLSAAACRMHPYLLLSAPSADSSWLGGDQENRPLLRDFLQRLATAYPAAGRAYWVTRCWGALSWQPLFLAVAAVHGAPVLPDFQRMQQKIHESSIHGFSLSPEWETHRGIEDSINHAGEQLQDLFAAYYEDVKALTAFSRYLSASILADTLLEALARLPLVESRFDNDTVLGLSHQWLAAMGLPHKGEMILKEGRLQVKRRSCCLHYRVESGERCFNCPGAEN